MWWKGNVVSYAVLALLPGLIVLAGAYLLFTWKRGVRRGVDPYCRRCEYCLIGIDSERCPECGADIRQRRAVVIGRRTHPRSRLMVGVTLTLLGLLPLGALGFGFRRQFNLSRFFPSSVLLLELKLDPNTGDLGILEGRALRKELSSSALRRLEDLCLTRIKQLPRDDPRSYRAGEVLGELVRRRLLDVEQIAEMFPEPISADLCAPRRVRAGEPIEIEVDATLHRFLNGGCVTGMHMGQLIIDGEPAGQIVRADPSDRQRYTGPKRTIHEPGMHWVDVEVFFQVHADRYDPQVEAAELAGAPVRRKVEVVFERKYVLSQGIEVQPAVLP